MTTSATTDRKHRIINKPAEHTSKKSVNKQYPIPDCVPFRPTSNYAKLWSIMYAHRQQGISRSDLTAKYRAWTGKPERLAQFDVHILQTPRQSGDCTHRSVASAAQHYWVEKEGDWLRLHLFSDHK